MLALGCNRCRETIGKTPKEVPEVSLKNSCKLLNKCVSKLLKVDRLCWTSGKFSLKDTTYMGTRTQLRSNCWAIHPLSTRGITYKHGDICIHSICDDCSWYPMNCDRWRYSVVVRYAQYSLLLRAGYIAVKYWKNIQYCYIRPYIIFRSTYGLVWLVVKRLLAKTMLV